MEILKLETIENIIKTHRTVVEVLENENIDDDYDLSLDKCIIYGMEELKQYRIAEEQGLLLRLPCKVGDVVWHEKKYATYLIGAHPYQITNVMISQNKKGEWTKKYRAMLIHNGKTIDCQVNFSFDDIGKTVFLTREEAEQALARMKEVR